MKYVLFSILMLAACTPELQEYIPPPERGPDIWPEVWTSNGFDGPTYEYKVNCGPEYDELYTCFLNNVTNVTVINPEGVEYYLNKDFNVNQYDGEATRRWVLYGPQGGDLPIPGAYTFLYIADNQTIYEETVEFTPQTINYPTNVSFEQIGNDLHVTWTPPLDAAEGMWYKALILPDESEVLSITLPYNATSAVMPNVPLERGATGTINVALYFHGGYAYSKYYDFTWQ